jgi:hypothetical protein
MGKAMIEPGYPPARRCGRSVIPARYFVTATSRRNSFEGAESSRDTADVHPGTGQELASAATGKIMDRLALLLASVAISAWSAAHAQEAPPLSCVPDDSCGCRIVVSGKGCPDGGAHFFHELADGSPLQLDFGQGAVTASSTQPRTNVFSPSSGDSWTETYRHDGGSIEIRYSPGTSTCPKLAQEEPCEFFDVNAKVRISGPQGTWDYAGVGQCGC